MVFSGMATKNALMTIIKHFAVVGQEKIGELATSVLA
jgi:hypothetical protein